MPKKYVPDGVYLACDKGCAPCRLKVTSHDFSYIYGLHLATEADKQPDVNIPPMHTCTATGKACEPKPTAWEKVKDGVSINHDRLLLEDSILPCSEGGIIKIYFSAAEAQAACAPPPPKKKSLLDKLSDAASHWGPVGTYVQFEIGVGEGIAGGVKGIGEGLWTLAKGGWHVATHPVETAESVGNATVAAANWASKGENWSNAYNATSQGISNAADWASKGENWSNTANSVGDWASKQSPRDWGNITGRGAFEVALAVGTAGAGEAVNGAAKVGEAANLAEKAGEAANLADKAGEVANLADKAGEAANMVDKLGEGQKLGEVVTETAEDVTKVPAEKMTGIRPAKPEYPVTDENGALTDYGKWYYDRPSGFRKGIRQKSYDAAKGDDGIVRDPKTKEEIKFDDEWDMGHKPGSEFRKHQADAASREVSRKGYLDEHNNYKNYRPETPNTNRSHVLEDETDFFNSH